ncbi:hypothetical protein [Synechococcus sp. 1G10]|uniref:hypothetical protein n=1 Tax=Synechococcus sp. 1G10 TaxID=2025605 RepID=UPI000B99032A|nr:hypothetical protein [Synechococcus sp. 1G10]
MAPSYFTYGSHAAFWMGFTPGLNHSKQPWLNPKAGKLFRLMYSAASGDDRAPFQLEGANIIEGFRRLGYHAIGTGAVSWFDPSTPTGAVLGAPFNAFHFAGNTWSLLDQLCWIELQLRQLSPRPPTLVFLNVGETHVPYWHQGADWPRWPSPCVPFGGPGCSAPESRRRQQACLEWVDRQLGPLLERFHHGTILACADHGDCWGENGLWEHGVSHWATLTVPLLLRVRGKPVTNPSRIRNAFARLWR